MTATAYPSKIYKKFLKISAGPNSLASAKAYMTAELGPENDNWFLTDIDGDTFICITEAPDDFLLIAKLSI